MSKWISVNESMPKQLQQAWVSFFFDCPSEISGQTSHQGYAIWDTDGGWYFDVSTDGELIGRKYCEDHGLLACTITHWMPLPSPPESEQ